VSSKYIICKAWINASISKSGFKPFNLVIFVYVINDLIRPCLYVTLTADIAFSTRVTDTLLWPRMCVIALASI